LAPPRPAEGWLWVFSLGKASLPALDRPTGAEEVVGRKHSVAALAGAGTWRRKVDVVE
jgi:hypothetical protein